MGVSGCGKSTIGTLLAENLQIPFYDGDDFHSVDNVEKMKAGTPLDDYDRGNWLENINIKAQDCESRGVSAVFACSALKNKYREVLSTKLNNFIWVYLKGSSESILERLNKRVGHFMPIELLKSQFATLEEPRNALIIDLTKSKEDIIVEIVSKMNKKEFGLVGLGVMGKSLARNLARNGTRLSLYNRFVENKEVKIAEKFVDEYQELADSIGFEDLPQFVSSLSTPRKIFLMIKAGTVTDLFLDLLLPLLEPEDIVIDGGNSHFRDTKRRIERLNNIGMYFIGTGVSGGEKGALEGPSIMPSGNKDAYELLQPYFEKIAAKDKSGLPCCKYIGIEGSGHFIKMVHNGIEYAEMQLLAEVYALLRYKNGLQPKEISSVFESWNITNLGSYLLEITAKLLKKTEPNGAFLIDRILDKAGNKGTGNWSSIEAIELGNPSTMITSALFARYLSTIKFQNEDLDSKTSASKEVLNIDIIKEAYALARIINHQQGFKLISEASKKYTWKLNFSEIARIWTNGCIIRSVLMESLVEELKNIEGDLLNSKNIRNTITGSKTKLKDAILSFIEADIPAPCFLSSLDYINALENKVKTANIIQAQRDFFGAHTYQRNDEMSEAYYHTEWE